MTDVRHYAARVKARICVDCERPMDRYGARCLECCRAATLARRGQTPDPIACGKCGVVFSPVRCTAVFCSATCCDRYHRKPSTAAKRRDQRRRQRARDAGSASGSSGTSNVPEPCA